MPKLDVNDDSDDGDDKDGNTDVTASARGGGMVVVAEGRGDIDGRLDEEPEGELVGVGGRKEAGLDSECNDPKVGGASDEPDEGVSGCTANARFSQAV